MAANATSICTAGACSLTCNTGFGNCDGMVANGCEVNLGTDRNNCGACGNVCPGMMVCSSSACTSMPLYHGWMCPIGGCNTSSYDTMVATADGGFYPYNMGDTDACRAWKLAATICTTAPMPYNMPSSTMDWTCPISGGFTDPVFGMFCMVMGQFACSDCQGVCNAMCTHHPLSLRDCMYREVPQL